MSVRLFIGNLPYAATEPELREHLSSVGEPTQIVLPVDRETGRPRGFAFVDYADRAVAEAAISRFDQQPFKGRPLAVSEARPREERPAGAPRPGGYSSPGPAVRRPVRAAAGRLGAPAPERMGAAARATRRRAGRRAAGTSAPTRRPRTSASRRGRIDRGPKGPIKERPVSRLYENDEDWRNEKDEEVDIDNIATSAKDDDAVKDDDTVDE